MFNSLEKYATDIGYDSIEAKDKNLKKLLMGEYSDKILESVLESLQFARTNDVVSYLGMKVKGSLVPASRPRLGSYGAYIQDPYRSYKEFFNSVLGRATEASPDLKSLYTSDRVVFDLNVYYSFPKSYSKSKRERLMLGGGFKSTTPDLDNLEKTVLDSLVQSGIIGDDRYVVKQSSSKHWTEYDDDFFIFSLKSV